MARRKAIKNAGDHVTWDPWKTQHVLAENIVGAIAAAGLIAAWILAVVFFL